MNVVKTTSERGGVCARYRKQNTFHEWPWGVTPQRGVPYTGGTPDAGCHRTVLATSRPNIDWRIKIHGGTRKSRQGMQNAFFMFSGTYAHR